MRKRILFLLPSVRAGGAERVMVTLLKNINRDKFELSLALVVREGPFLADIPPDVKIYDLKAKRARNSFIPLVKLIWKIKPDVILSTQGYLNLILLMVRRLLPKGLKIIVREGSIVSEKLFTIKNGWLWRRLYRTFYKKADLIVCQSKHMLDDLYNNFNAPFSKLIQIFNPVDINHIREMAKQGSSPFHENNDTINILSVGRLSREKRHDRIIEAMPQLLKLRPNAKLWIVGTGKLEKELIDLRDRLGLHDKVVFVGYQSNPYLWMSHADLMVLASEYEGLPNVVLEAIACKCSFMIKDHPGGTREIVETIHQEGRIVHELAWEDAYFEKLNEKTISIFEKNFSADVITRAYENILIQ